MATEKAKREKEIKSVAPKKVSAETLTEAGKKSPAKKAVEKKEVVEVKKPKKAVAEKEEKTVAEVKKSIAEKTNKKAKATSIPEEKIAVPETPVAAEVLPEPTKPVVTKKAAAKKVKAEPVVALESVIDTKAAEVVAPAAKATKPAKQSKVKLTFQLKYSTSFGQQLFLVGNNEKLGNGEVTDALPMQYFNEEYWYAEVEMLAGTTPLLYNYVLSNQDGSIISEPTNNKSLPLADLNGEVLVIDSWTNESFNNNLYTESSAENLSVANEPKTYTHLLKIKAAPLPEGYQVFVAGNIAELGNWTEDNIKLLSYSNGLWTLKLNLSKAEFPVVYKYGLYNVAEKKVVEFEAGDNRIFYNGATPKSLTIVADGSILLQSDLLKMAV